MQKSLVKTMPTLFFDAEGIIRHEFMPASQAVNGKFYKEVIKRLIARVHRVRPEFQERGPWYLLHDNASAHSSGIISEFLAKRGIPVLSHPPYSSDLALPVSFLFSELKIAIKATRFMVVSSIQPTLTREVKGIREEAFSGAFDSLYERCKRCEETGGDYIE
jgi:hypothetical protein